MKQTKASGTSAADDGSRSSAWPNAVSWKSFASTEADGVAAGVATTFPLPTTTPGMPGPTMRSRTSAPTSAESCCHIADGSDASARAPTIQISTRGAARPSRSQPCASVSGKVSALDSSVTAASCASGAASEYRLGCSQPAPSSHSRHVPHERSGGGVLEPAAAISGRASAASRRRSACTAAISVCAAALRLNAGARLRGRPRGPRTGQRERGVNELL